MRSSFATIADQGNSSASCALCPAYFFKHAPIRSWRTSGRRRSGRIHPGRPAGLLRSRRLHALGVEDAGWQPQEGMHVAIVQQLFADGLTRAALEQHVVGHYDCGPAVDLEQRFYVLEEVELLVAGGGPEVVAYVGEGFFRFFTFFIDHGDARFLAERRIG